MAIVTGIFPPDIGGPATHSADLRDELRRRGHNVMVVTLWEGRGTDRSPDVIRFPRRWPWLVRLAAVAAWLVNNRHRFDVVYATGLHPAAVAGGRLADRPVVVKIVGDVAWERGRRLGLTEHDFDRFQEAGGGSPRLRAMRKVQNWSLRRASTITTPSDYLAGIVEGWLEGPADVRVISNGVLRPAVDWPPAPDDGELRTIFVGRLVPHKRVDLLLEALATTPGVALEIVGDGPERSRLEKRVRELRLDDRITFTGALAHDEVLERLARSHALVLVSDYEGLPHVALEALACGVPLVALPVGGTVSILRDRENGILLSDPSHQAIARSLNTLRRDDELRRRLADGARRSGAEWGMDRCAQRIIELFDQAILGKPRTIFVGKSRIPAPITRDFRRKLEIFVRHLEPTIFGVGLPGKRLAGRARLVCLPARLIGGLDGALFYSAGPALAVSLAAARRRCAIVCQSPYEAFGALLLARGLPKSIRPRVVVEVHGDWRTATRLYGGRARRRLISISDRAAAWAIRRADRVRVISEWLERLVRGMGYEGEIDRFLTYSNMAEFLAAPILSLPAEPRVGYIGVLDEPKGVDLLLESWGKVTAHVPGARLLIAGDGPLRKDLVGRCARLGLNESVEFLGHLSSPDLITLLDGCSCVVVPSRSEGLGRVALEAMARARPVVATKVGGLPELVEDGRNGVLVAPEDPEQLAGAIVGLLRRTDYLEEMGREGRRRALERDPVAEFESGISRLAAWVDAR